MKIRAGQYYVDRAGRTRGPIQEVNRLGMVWCVKDEYGFNAFKADGSWIDKAIACELDLVAEAPDWQAVAKERLEFIQRLNDHREVDMPDIMRLEMEEMLRIEREPDPEDDAAQKGDFARKLQQEEEA